MKSIKAKVRLIASFLLITAFGFGGLTFKSNQKIQKLQEKIIETLQIQNEFEKINPEIYDSRDLQQLRKYRKKLSKGNQRYIMNRLIKAYKAGASKSYESERKELKRAGNHFIKIVKWNIKNYKQWTQFYLLLTILFPLIGLVVMIHYLKKEILSPLESLSRRIMEFLVNQYTFQFSSPPNNEIGNLERKFNSLAQKVLYNMDQLHALDRAKSDFVNIASHELRTPLTSIKGSLSLLSNNIIGQLDEEAKEMILMTENETDRLVRIINDMLDLAKIESRALTLKKRWQSLYELFDKTVKSLQGLAQTARVHLEISPAPKNYEVLIDGDRIHQVLTNLISNAVKYSPEGGVVTLAYSAINESNIEISVSDQGRGISEENKRLIFEKFRQATDSSHHLVNKGTGLGLAISKALVEEHGGQIGVRSSVHGSTFYFHLHHWRQINKVPTKPMEVAA